MQGTGACEAAVPHVSSPEHGVAGRGLSKEFDEELQGSKAR